ncbi:MAG TPA: hypothetical protein P5277_01455 [Candidatus Paceibacterota bacterium]|nr:hypothetical protein [Candidatus Paceibacterota bacterium]
MVEIKKEQLLIEEYSRRLMLGELPLVSSSGRYQYYLIVPGERVSGAKIINCRRNVINEVNFNLNQDRLKLDYNLVVSLGSWIAVPKTLEEFSPSDFESFTKSIGSYGVKLKIREDLAELSNFEKELRKIFGDKYRRQY